MRRSSNTAPAWVFGLGCVLGGGAAQAATFPAGFQQQTFTGISTPTQLGIAPDGRVFVAQQCGPLRVIKDGGLLATPFATLPVSCSDERGLHGIAFDPGFATNGYVYVRFTRSGTVNNVIGRLRVSSSNPDVSDGTVTLLFTIPFNGNRYHHGGGLQVGSDGKLYSSIGDHESGSGQSLSNLWGKVIRINIPDGSIPTDNPFYTTATGNNRAIWAYGFRNPFTMDVQPGTGRIHVNDVGADKTTGREEVNHLLPGSNYQWPNSQGPSAYFSYAAASLGGNAITGGDFYNPQTVMFPAEYVGRYFFGDYGGGWVRHINGSGGAGTLTGFGGGISGPTDVEVHPDGSLYIAARNASSVIRVTHGVITPTPTPTPSPTPTPTGSPAATPTPTPTPFNTIPMAHIAAPPSGTLYKGGDVISFAGDCGDAEDGTLPASGFHWSIVFHHNTHTHPGLQFPGVKGGSFEIPTVGEVDPDQWWRIHLTCTDAQAVAASASRDVFPKKQALTLATSPAGLQVDADTFGGPSPQTMDAIVNTRRILHTAAPQTLDGLRYFFERWSDGGERRHEILMPDAATTYTAQFRPASDYGEITPPCGSGVTASTSDANGPCNVVDNDLATRWSGNGDGAWVKLDMGAVKTIGHVNVAVYQGHIRRNRFDLQVSSDNMSWSTVFSGESSGTTTQEEQYDFPDQAGRWVRYLGHGNIGTTNPSMNSVTEISLFAPVAPPANTIFIRSMTYTPSPFTARAGTTVTWENQDTVSHTVTFDGGLDSGPIPPGGRWSAVFDVVGTFVYHCTFHPGMTGELVVTAPPPTPTPTPLTPTPTPTPEPTATPQPTATPTATPTPRETPTYVEAPASATASTHDGNLPANAVDGSLATRWSANGDGQWLQLDLGSVKTVGYVRVAAYAGNLRANMFDIGVSASPTGPFTLIWQDARTTGTTTQEETFDFADVSARYVRYIGHGNSDPTKATWNSVSEMSVYVATVVAPTPTPTQPPPPDGLEITPPASAVTASTHDGNLPGNTVDNSLATRWSASGDNQWVRFDLGTWRNVSHVKVAVYNGNSRRNKFELQVSDEGAEWRTVWMGESSGTTTLEELYDFFDQGARYVRYLGHGSSVNTFNSVTEVSLFAPPEPTPTPTPTRAPTPPPGSPVAVNGQLRVCGNRICNRYGQPIQLRGMSTNGLQWFANCIDNDAAVNALAGDWQADVLRVTMFIQEGGYETDPVRFTALADRIIDRAIARGLYVIIDWHVQTPGDPMFNLSRARGFFTHMAQRYGSQPHVLYEIASTPNGVTWARIRDYALQINPTIRAHDPDNIILIGSRAFASLGLADGLTETTGPDEIINNPVPGTNLAYTFQFFATSHRQTFRNALSYAADHIPMWVTQWGTQTFTGDGTNDFASSQLFVDLMQAKKISWTNWNWSDGPRSGDAFTPGTCPSGPYAGTTRLKPAGAWIRERIQIPPDAWPTTPPAP